MMDAVRMLHFIGECCSWPRKGICRRPNSANCCASAAPWGRSGSSVKKHDVSLDWLMDGDLKGLQRMKKWAKEDPDEQRARILRKFGALKPSYQKIILEWIETAATEDNASA